MRKWMRNIFLLSLVMFWSAVYADEDFAAATFYSKVTVSDGDAGGGKQRILTDFTPTGTEIVRAKFTTSAATTNGLQTLFCVRSNEGMYSEEDPGIVYFLHHGNGKARFDYFDRQGSASERTVCQPDTTYYLECRNGQAQVWDEAGQKLATFGPYYTVQPMALKGALNLFSVANWNSNPVNPYPLEHIKGGANIGFHYLRVYATDDGIAGRLIHEYIPCSVPEKGVGIADTVTEKVFYNQSPAEDAATQFKVQASDVIPLPEHDAIFARKTDITLSPEAQAAIGDATLRDFPVPVRLSTAIANFTYSDFRHDGVDMKFVDAAGNLLVYERETYDPSGESLFWVKIPQLTSNTTFTCYFSCVDEFVHDSSKVWSSYAAVVHGGQLIENAAVNGLKVSAGGANVQGTSTTLGLGDGIVQPRQSVGVYLQNPVLTNALTNARQVTISGWYNQQVENASKTAIFFSDANSFTNSRMTLLLEKGSWLSVADGTYYGDAANFGGHQPGTSNGKGVPALNAWTHIGFSYDKTNSSAGRLRTYFQGENIYASDTAFANTDIPDGCATNWTFGSFWKSATDSFIGEMDELRVYDGIASETWMACEYGFAKNPSFLRYDQVESGIEGAVLITTPSVAKTDDGYVVTVTNRVGTGRLYLVWGPTYPFAYTNEITSASTEWTEYKVPVVPPADYAATCGYGVYSVGVAVSDGREVYEERLGRDRMLFGRVAITKQRDASESQLGNPGLFNVTRPEGTTDGELVVHYVVSGTAEPDRHYAALPGTVTIPAGETTGQIEVWPKLSQEETSHAVTVTLTDGLYDIRADHAAATLKILPYKAGAGYAKKFTCTVEGYSGKEVLTNFPVLVRLNTGILGFNYRDFKCADGADLCFIDDQDNPLPYEIDTWDPAGTTLVWVQVPRVVGGETKTQFYGFFGYEAPTANNPADVWTNGYVAVYHLNESSLPLRDSTSYANHFTRSLGDQGSELAVAGIAGGSVDLKETGHSRGFQAADADQLDGFAAMTVEAWTWQASHNLAGIVSKRKGSDSDLSWMLYDAGSKTAFRPKIVKSDGSTVNPTITMSTSDAPPLEAWNRQACTYVGATGRGTYFLNKVAKDYSTTAGTIKADLGPLHLGTLHEGDAATSGKVNGRNFPGKIDEVRISNVARSADWLNASYDTVMVPNFAKPSDVEDNTLEGTVPTVESLDLSNGRATFALAPEKLQAQVWYGLLEVASPSSAVTVAEWDKATFAYAGDAQPESFQLEDEPALTAADRSAWYYRVAAREITEGVIMDEAFGDAVYGILRLASSATNTLVAVPCSALGTDSGDISAPDLVKTVNLTAGDQLLSYDARVGVYRAWVVFEDEDRLVWQPIQTVSIQGVTVGQAEIDARLARGGAFWLHRQHPVDGTGKATAFYLSGRFPLSTPALTIVGGSSETPAYTMVGNPTAGAVPLNALDWGTGPVAGDQISIPDGRIPRLLSWDASKGEWYRMVSKLVYGRVRQVRETGDAIPAGMGFWYLRRTPVDFTFEWTLKGGNK